MKRRGATFTAFGAVLMLGTALPGLDAQRDGPTIGQPAPEFSLADTHGVNHALADYRGAWVVLEWLNYECPYVQKHYGGGNMQRLQQAYGARGVKWLAIVSSAPGRQGYHEPDEMNSLSEERGSKALAVLLDPDGTVGKLYGAKATPQMVVIDPQGLLRYNGAIDDKPSSHASSLDGAHNYVAAALDEAMAGKPVTVPTSKPYGCAVKYKY